MGIVGTGMGKDGFTMSFRIDNIQSIFDNGDFITVITANAVIHLPDRIANTKHHITLGTGSDGHISHMHIDLDQDEPGMDE